MAHRQANLTDYKSNRTTQTSQTNQTKQTTQCPRYNQAVEKCKRELDERIINDLNILEIGCGHAIDYFTDNIFATISEGTADSYRSYLRIYIEFLHKRNMNACEAEYQNVDNYMKRLARNNRAKSTMSGHKSALTNLYKHISLHRDMDPNVDYRDIREEIDLSDYRTPERRERDYLEKYEIKILFDNLKSFRDRLMTQVGVELGPRNIDICSLPLNAVDLEEQRIILSNKKSGGSYPVPVSAELTILLRRWIKIERKAIAGSNDSKYLFPKDGGDRLEPGSFRARVKSAAEKGGIQDKVQSEAPLTEREKEVLGTDKDYKHYYRITPHTLRHTFYHLMVEAGVPKEARSDAMDHNSVEITDEFYDHEESNYTELMDTLFSGVNITLA